MNIGSNIKYLRQQKKMTQDWVAEQLGISYQAVSKWENDANTPDIALLPKIAALFGISIDALFSENIAEATNILSFAENDNTIRIVQMRGTQVLKVTPFFSQDTPPIEIAFPRNCNDETQYFNVEVHGHIICDGSINGDVKCHQTIQCHKINACGNVIADGDIKVNEINSSGTIVCNNIMDNYKIEAEKIECSGNINSTNLTCSQIEYNKQSAVGDAL